MTPGPKKEKRRNTNENKRHRGRQTPVTKQRCEKIRVSSPGRRGAATGGRLFLPAPANGISLLGCLGWLGAAQKSHTASSDGHVLIEL